ncbi:hypothetical protein BgiMline_030577, partial [Biomphalaria glabrata]
ETTKFSPVLQSSEYTTSPLFTPHYPLPGNTLSKLSDYSCSVQAVRSDNRGEKEEKQLESTASSKEQAIQR